MSEGINPFLKPMLNLVHKKTVLNPTVYMKLIRTPLWLTFYVPAVLVRFHRSGYKGYLKIFVSANLKCMSRFKVSAIQDLNIQTREFKTHHPKHKV